MRDFNEYLLKLKNVTPGETINGTGTDVSRVLDVENARAHTIAVKLVRHSKEVSQEPFLSVEGFIYYAGNNEVEWDTSAGTLSDLGVVAGLVVSGSGIPASRVLEVTGDRTFTLDDDPDDGASYDTLTFTLLPWSPSSETVTITVYAVLPPRLANELPPGAVEEEQLLELETVTMTLADLAAKGYGRSEGLCGYSSVRVKLESESTAWPMFGQLAVWGLVNRDRC